MEDGLDEWLVELSKKLRGQSVAAGVVGRPCEADSAEIEPSALVLKGGRRIAVPARVKVGGVPGQEGEDQAAGRLVGGRGVELHGVDVDAETTAQVEHIK